MPSSVLGIVKSLGSKMDKVPALKELAVSQRQTLNKYTCPHIITSYDKCSEGKVQGALRDLNQETKYCAETSEKMRQ